MSNPTLLFVHGAWHGSWCWEPVTSRLTEQGWRVQTVDLPTVHAPNKAELGMFDDAKAVSEAIEAIDGPVVVVAHSYGGVPTTQGADLPNVQHIVYVAAFALGEGQSLFGAVGGVEPDWWNVEGPLVSAGNEDEPPQLLFFHDVPEEAAAEAASRLTSMAKQAVHDELTTTAWSNTPTTFVITENDAVFPLAAQQGLAEAIGANTVTLTTSHSPFFSQPKRLAEIIVEAATGVDR